MLEPLPVFVSSPFLAAQWLVNFSAMASGVLLMGSQPVRSRPLKSGSGFDLAAGGLFF
jgi:hypothetical protein